MVEQISHSGGEGQPARGRLIRRSKVSTVAVDRFGLASGEMYRISYSIRGTGPESRVSRSVALFTGESERRSWSGEAIKCLDFVLPHGRKMSLLSEQLVDAKNAHVNDHGQYVLS